jgi:hypothetical protein
MSITTNIYTGFFFYKVEGNNSKNDNFFTIGGVIYRSKLFPEQKANNDEMKRQELFERMKEWK